MSAHFLHTCNFSNVKDEVSWIVLCSVQYRDKRSGERLIKIIRIEGEYALVVSSFDQFRWSVRETRIHLNRFNPTATGYRLVSAENGGRHA